MDVGAAQQDAGLFDLMMHGLMPAPQLYGTWSK